MFEFAQPLLFLLLPLPLLLLLLPKKKQPEAMVLLMPTIPYLGKGEAQSQTKRWQLPFILLIWALLVGSAARLQWQGAPIALDREGRDLMMAVDLSGSMAEEDMEHNGRWHNRLTAVKAVLSEFIAKRKGDRVGLILFADHAYLQTPLTFDLNTVSRFLDDSELGLVGKQTAIGEAVGLAIKRFVQSDQEQRILILLTDGQNTAGNISPIEAAKLAAKENITIYTVGVGAHEMLRRSLFGTQRYNPSADLDEATLTKMAELTGGRYFRASNPAELAQIYQQLDQLNPIEQDKKQFRPRTELFYYPLTLALLLLIVLFLTQSKRAYD